MKQNKFYLSSPSVFLDFEQTIALAKLTHVTQPAAGVLHLPLDAELEGLLKDSVRSGATSSERVSSW